MTTYKGRTTNANQYFKTLRESTSHILGVTFKRQEFKQMVYKFKDGEMGIYDKVNYCLLNMDEFIKFIIEYEA